MWSRIWNLSPGVKSPIKVPQNKQSSILFQHLSLQLDYQFISQVCALIHSSKSFIICVIVLTNVFVSRHSCNIRFLSALKPFFIKLPLSQVCYAFTTEMQTRTNRERLIKTATELRTLTFIVLGLDSPNQAQLPLPPPLAITTYWKKGRKEGMRDKRIDKLLKVTRYLPYFRCCVLTCLWALSSFNSHKGPQTSLLQFIFLCLQN